MKFLLRFLVALALVVGAAAALGAFVPAIGWKAPAVILALLSLVLFFG